MKRVFRYAVAVLGLYASCAQAFLIDDFDSYQSVVIMSAAPTSKVDVLADPAVLGGWRKISVLKTAGGTGFTNVVAAEASADVGNPNTFQVSNGTFSDSTVTLTWDGNGGGLGGVDITDAGAATGIFISLLVTDLPQTSLRFDAVSSSGASSASVLFASAQAGVDVFLPFSSFVGSANFTQLNGLSLTLDGAVSWDAAFDNLRTAAAPIIQSTTAVPEPASLALLGLGLALLGWSQWRRGGRGKPLTGRGAAEAGMLRRGCA